MITLDLRGAWKLRPEFLDCTACRAQEVLSRPDGDFRFGAKHFPAREGWLDAEVPCDVLEPLMRAGFVQEPTEGLNSRDCTWTKDLSWWFRRSFDCDAELLGREQARLFIETLDYEADILLNGVPVAKHSNAFLPFEMDVKPYLRPGENTLLIRLTNGAECGRPPMDSLSYYNASGEEPRRCYLRKPQFSYGWDWCPCVPTCGIGGRVELRGVSGALVRDVRLDTLRIDGDSAEVALRYTLEELCVTRSGFATLEWRLSYEGTLAAQGSEEVQLTGGLNYGECRAVLSQPRLWHALGMGKPNLYDLSVSVRYRGGCDEVTARVGVRTIAIDCSPLPDGTRNFRFTVNGQPVFCMGGNWVPPDVIYLRTKRGAYRALIEEAAAMNCNMLRMWGGGRYEPDFFYELCSEHGILVMHDFMYACALYPDEDERFLLSAIREADYQTLRLAKYPCMAVWTGNNEIAESYWGWYDPLARGRREFGAYLFNYALPKAGHDNAPATPYMPSSPFFGEWAKDPAQGDIHLWGTLVDLKRPYGMNDYHSFLPHVTHELYDEVAKRYRFNSEYGFYGSAMPSTIRRYHGQSPVRDDVLAHHKEPDGDGGMRALCVENLLTPVKRLTGDERFVYAAVAQGIEYNQLTRALRAQAHCSGNLIWMFNDAWPESGFTPIDYYLTRKPSFYYLKRAFAPRKLLIVVRGGRACVALLNGSCEAVSLTYEYGFMTYGGGTVWRETAQAELAPCSFTQGPQFIAVESELRGLYYIRAVGDDRGFAHDTSSREYWRDTPVPEGSVELVRQEAKDDGVLLTLRCGKAYVPIVEIQCEDDRTHMEDNYFDMLPEQTRSILVHGAVKRVRALPLCASARDYDPRDPEDFRRARGLN